MAVQPQPHHPTGNRGPSDGVGRGGDRSGRGCPGKPQWLRPVQPAKAHLGVPLGAHSGRELLSGAIEHGLVDGWHA
jgi:hypothetical protein